jgi:hypothetical protein
MDLLRMEFLKINMDSTMVFPQISSCLPKTDEKIHMI